MNINLKNLLVISGLVILILLLGCYIFFEVKKGQIDTAIQRIEDKKDEPVIKESPKTGEEEEGEEAETEGLTYENVDNFYLKTHSGPTITSPWAYYTEVTSTGIYRKYSFKIDLSTGEKEVVEYFEALLSEEEFVELVDLVVNKNDFFDLPEKLYLKPEPLDVGTPGMEVTYGGKTHEVSVWPSYSEDVAGSSSDLFERLNEISNQVMRYDRKFSRKEEYEEYEEVKNRYFYSGQGDKYPKVDEAYPLKTIKEVNNLNKAGIYNIEGYLADIYYYNFSCPRGAACSKRLIDHLIFTDEISKFRGYLTQAVRSMWKGNKFKKLFRNTVECTDQELVVDLNESEDEFKMDWVYFRLDNKYKLTIELISKEQLGYYPTYDCSVFSDEFIVRLLGIERID